MTLHQAFVPALPRALPPAARRKVEKAAQAHADALAALVAFLDIADGDADLEPSLGYIRPLSGLAEVDLEAECEDEGAEHDGREPDADNEPSLGALLNHDRQIGWANSNTEDVEDALAHD